MNLLRRVNCHLVTNNLYKFKNKNQNVNLLIYRKKCTSDWMLGLANKRTCFLGEIHSCF